MAWPRKNIARNARKCLLKIPDETRTGVFRSKGIFWVFRDLCQVENLPDAIFQMQEIWSALRNGVSLTVKRRYIKPRPAVVNFEKKNLVDDLLVAAQCVENCLAFNAAFSRSVYHVAWLT